MLETAAYLIIIWNASNWGTPGDRRYEYADMAACGRALAEMKIANEKPNSGVAVVAFCSPLATHVSYKQPKP